MLQLLHVIEPPRECSYLPRETAALEVRAIFGMRPEEYSDLLARGYRRFGWQVFRPACPGCRQCRSIRVLARDFEPSRSQQRILRQNADIRAELLPAHVSEEQVELYNLYHRFMNGHRGWPLRQTTLDGYRREFLSGGSASARQWLYRRNGKLTGVALMDEVPDAVSLVYCFYDPEWRGRSPGTYSILNQLLYAKAKDLPYAYLGYWIEACQSMSYKNRFGPHQILRSYPAENEVPVWD